MSQKQLNKSFLYVVAFLSSLSIAGASMTLLALSAAFFEKNPSGFASSSIQVAYFMAVGLIGILGGKILQAQSVISVGISGSIISAIIVFFLASLETIPLSIGLVSIFVIFLFAGIEHPNKLRFFNEALPEHRKMAFFSISESITALFTVISPAIAGILIAQYGNRFCFIIDGCTYLLSCIPWLIICVKKIETIKSHEKKHWLVGFQELYRNQYIRMLTIGRLLNNLAYVFCTTAVPLVIARIVQGNVDYFASYQGIVNSTLSVGFIVAGLCGSRITKNNQAMIPMVYLGSFLGWTAFCSLILSMTYPWLLAVSTFILGIGTYCFRLSGMTLGQAFTPPELIGSVIIAGDAIVRLCSFLIALATLSLFEIGESLSLSPMIFFIMIIFFPSCCLLSPFWTKHLAHEFSKRNRLAEK